MFRDGRQLAAFYEKSAEARRKLPFWTTVSRLLSAPAGLLFNFRSRYSLRYRTRARIQPWGGGTPRSRCTLKQRYCASELRGAAGPSHALNLGPGSAPFARRYSGHRLCFLLLGLLICLSSARRLGVRGANFSHPKLDAVQLSKGAPLRTPRGCPQPFEG